MSASYFTLRNKTQNEFNIWVDKLPIRLRPGQIEALWLRSKGRKSILWTHEGLVFF